ncbi:MAG: hypothetical protein ACJ8DC_11340 [Gemmatimonadales bacterium]
MSCAKVTSLACWLALAAAACGGDVGEPTATSNDQSAQAFDRIGGVPLGGACATSYELTDLVLVNEKDLLSATYHDQGDCRLSHLGAATLSNSGSIDFSTVPAQGTGTFSLVAANGDRLDGTERIAYDVPDENGLFGFSGIRTITGGTGRFAEAHGAVSITGIGSTEANTTQQNLSGHIVY